MKKIFSNSQWIWNKKEYSENEYAEFYDIFNWEEGKTTINISVCGDYTLFVNGEFAESNQYGDFEHYKVYDSIDITPYLKKGENRISILAWYFGKSGMRYSNFGAGLIYEIENNKNIIAYSSEKTMSRKSLAYKSGERKTVSPQLGCSFEYNSTLEDAWINGEIAGFTESAVTSEKKDFYKRPIKKLVLSEPCFGTLSGEKNRYLVDLGKELVGLCTFSFYSEQEQKILISYSESLKDGRVRRIIDYRDFSFDYIAKKGENKYTNYMFRLAGRYIEIESEYPIKLDYIGLIPQSYPAKVKEFKPENELDRKIYEICMHTLNLCMMEHYVDCPWREQCLYAFDSRNQMLTGYYAYEDGNFDYVRANLLLMSKDKREDNFLSICFPSKDDLTIPSFTLYYVVAVKEYIEYSGDLTLAEEVFDKMESLFKPFVNNIKNGVIHTFEGANHWNFYDWTEYAEGTLWKEEEVHPDLLINSIFMLSLSAFDFICKKLCKENIYAHFKNEIKENCQKIFYNESTGFFFIKSAHEKPTELANSLAVLSGIATKEQSEKICKNLAEGNLMSSTLSMKYFKYTALLSYDKNYKDVILEEIRNTYKKMLDAGATTVWETQNGEEDFGGAGSLCHGWSAIPIYYYQLFFK